MTTENKSVRIASPEVTDDLTRKVLIWLSKCTDIPETVDMIQPEPMLEAGRPGMELSVVQSSVTRTYILGGFEGEYQFAVFYRVLPKSSADRLKAMQTLNQLGTYASTTTPELGNNVQFIRCEVTSQAQLFAPYENGDEDYQIQMKLRYEVI